MARVYGFDWEIYAQRVMPAFARWLIDDDETNIYQLYRQTRCAQEEQFVPHIMQQLQTWPRAQAFVQQLPRGLHAHREYQQLCDAVYFTDLSDLYFHRHPPQLYQNATPLRVIWGAIVEAHCISWFDTPCNAPTTEAATAEEASVPGEESIAVAPTGVMIGRPPSILHMRGWLATISVRSMALFELLAFGRRCMPFGYRANEPFEAYIGYLTPDELWQLALCLRNVQPPNQTQAKEQYTRFRLQQAEHSAMFSMIDEVLPAHAEAFLKAVRTVAPQGLGLICSTD